MFDQFSRYAVYVTLGKMMINIDNIEKVSMSCYRSYRLNVSVFIDLAAPAVNCTLADIQMLIV